MSQSICNTISSPYVTGLVGAEMDMFSTYPRSINFCRRLVISAIGKHPSDSISNKYSLSICVTFLILLWLVLKFTSIIIIIKTPKTAIKTIKNDELTPLFFFVTYLLSKIFFFIFSPQIDNKNIGKPSQFKMVSPVFFLPFTSFQRMS